MSVSSKTAGALFTSALKLVEKVEKLAGLSRSVVEQSGLVRAAVLVPIVVRDEELRLIFTKRAMNVANHKGQISFPGGVQEPQDQSQIDTALRETEEEIGLRREHIRAIGMLNDYVTSTGFLVTPVIGFVNSTASFQSDPIEVEEIFEAPLSIFSDPSNHEVREFDPTTHAGHIFHVYHYEDRIIWGVTAGIVHNFIEELGKIP